MDIAWILRGYSRILSGYSWILFGYCVDIAWIFLDSFLNIMGFESFEPGFEKCL